MKIVASSGLDEHAIEALLDDGAPIDAFGVGTQLGVAADAPVIDLSYKLVEYAGTPRVKHSTGKINLPGRKQVFRRHDARGGDVGDVIAGRDEAVEGARPLLMPCVVQGEASPEAMAAADAAPERVVRELDRLPASLRRLDASEGEGDYPVTLSEDLARRAGEA